MVRPIVNPTLACLTLLFFSTAAGSLGCSSESAGSGAESAGSGSSAAGSCSPFVVSVDETCSSASDPLAGVFTIDQALGALPGSGAPVAIIETDVGTVTCTLDPEAAPNGVANFIGLARGQRPWLDPASGRWVKRPFYNGLLFHRVIAEFMAQGGDPLGTGRGFTGYRLEDEISDLSHEPGTLAYANSGPDSSSSQFYITDSAHQELDGDYTILGQCFPLSIIVELTHVKTDVVTDRPLTDLHMKTITIIRNAP
jgi:peptidyl-prolyl cis-trans isomerase A (cyclophilin A)